MAEDPSAPHDSMCRSPPPAPGGSDGRAWRVRTGCPDRCTGELIDEATAGARRLPRVFRRSCEEFAADHSRESISSDFLESLFQ
jgi:hypothetical protein